ncbi:MAG: glycosyltransferase [Candidatus Dependentiae bacterium]|nr:glycosyltransferase [Candidatus Dependentiae bacterium]
MMRNIVFRIVLFLCISTMCNAMQQRHITVIIPSFNNQNYYRHNLDSVFSQTYRNVSVIYINDCSTDNTGTLVDQYVSDNHLQHCMKVIHNPYNRGATANIYGAVHMCNDTDLIVLLDGDDAFLHTRALETIERIHRERGCWVSYAQFKNLPEHKAKECGLPVMGYAQPTPAEVIKNKSYRNYPWSWSGIRSFDAWIFKQIRLTDVLDTRPGHEGKFFEVCYDNAFLFPMMEMSGERFTFIAEPLLYRNVDTPLNDFKVKSHVDRTEIQSMIRAKPRYPTLQQPIMSDPYLENHRWADIVIFVDEVERLASAIECWIQAHGVGEIHVCYDAKDEAVIKKIQRRYPIIQLHNLERKPFASVMKKLTGGYVMISSTSLQHSPLDVTACINLMDKTRAFCFYFSYDARSFKIYGTLQDLPTSLIHNDIMVCHCKILREMNSECLPCNRALTLYRKHEIAPAFVSDDLTSIAMCDQLFNGINVDGNAIALLPINNQF